MGSSLAVNPNPEVWHPSWTGGAGPDDAAPSPLVATLVMGALGTEELQGSLAKTEGDHTQLEKL